MRILEGLIEEYEDYRSEFDYSKNFCATLFDSVIRKGTIDEDVYLAAKAYTSIISQIINRKIEYANFIIAGQTELLSFLNTFDDNYLSASEKLLGYQNCNEQIFLAELRDDINNLIIFFKDFLFGLLDDNEPVKNNLRIQIEEMIKEFEKKYKRGDYDE